MKRMATMRTFSLYVLLSVVTCVSITSADVTGNSEVADADKYAYIGEILKNNLRLTKQLWNIGLAAASNSSTGSGISGSALDDKTKHSLYNYILDNIPVVLKNDVFKAVSHDILDEMSAAYNKSDVSKNITAFQNENGTFTSDAATDLLKHLDVVRLLQRSIESGKPIIDDLRREDSTIPIAVVNYLIGMTPVVWKDPIFQKIKGIVTQELTLGYNKFTKGLSVTGPALAKQNSTLLVMGVLKNTNIQRMLLRSLKAAKPIIDKIRGQDSTVMLMGLGFLAKEYPIIMADHRFQHVQAVVSEYFGESFKRLNYTVRDLQTNQNEVIKNVLANTSKIHLIQDILRGGSARDVLSLTANDDVDQTCYGDIMDSVDSLVELKSWALKMFDSMGKLREGVLYGQLNMIGSYEECVSIKANIRKGTVLGNRTKDSASSFGTRYCRVSMNIPSTVLPVDTKGLPVYLTWGACVPDSCQTSDIAGMFHMEAIHNMTPIFDGVYVYCFDDSSITDDDSAIAAIVVLSIFALLILGGTLYVMIANMKLSSNSENLYEVPRLPLKPKEDTHPYEYLNRAYITDPETKVDLSLGNGSSEGRDIPSGYMPHAEGKPNGTLPVNGSVVNGNAGKENHAFHQIENVKQQNVEKAKEQGAEKSKEPKKKEVVIVRILKAFALQENVPKILSGKIGRNSINCLHGIRFLSLTWVILGHTFNYGIVSTPSIWTTENIVKAADLLKRFTFQAVIAGGFAVDTFYMLSGMLLTYLQVKQLEKLTAKFNCGKTAAYTFNYYFHRLWRLTPMYMIVIMIYSCLMKYCGDGPLWPSAIESADACKVNWWTNLLYINNLVNVDNECMSWSWFLANDMQFYVISLFFLIFLAISIPLGCVLIVLLMIGGISATGYEEQIYNGSFLTMKSDNGGYWKNVYIAPWCRVSPFCVGLLLGVLMYKRPRKPLKTITALIGWAAATAMALALVYCTYSENKEGGTKWSRDFRAVYESLGRPLWAACVAWVVFACHNGNGWVVDKILSWPGLIPLSRMSYAAYLLHPLMMMIHIYSKRALVYIADYDIIYLFLGHTCLTFMVAFVISVSFEAPFMALEKIIMGR